MYDYGGGMAGLYDTGIIDIMLLSAEGVPLPEAPLHYV